MRDSIESSLEADLAAAEDPRQALDHVLDRLVAWRRYYWLGVYKVDGTVVRRVAFRGPDPSCGDFELGKGNVGTTAQTGEARSIPDVTQCATYQQCFVSVKSELILPIAATDAAGKRTIVGVLDVESDEKDYFTDEDEEVLAWVCGKLAPLLA